MGKHPLDIAPVVAASFTAGFLLGVMVSHQPAKASDDGVKVTITEDSPLPPTEGCNPYIVINPPDLPPDASNMNGITITTNIGDVCGNWQGETQVVPSLPVPRV